MSICILGNGLTSLTLAKTLAKLSVKVDIFKTQRIINLDNSRTLAISNDNIKFFNEKIVNIEKLLWDIKKIEIFSENLKNEKLIDFKNNNKRLFSIIRNNDLNKLLLKKLRKNKFVKFKENYDFDKNNYKLIINCDKKNQITKKFFYNKNTKNYFSFAHTAVVKHKKIFNNIARQFFTKQGPVAFLPISSTETSVVFSIKGKKDIDFESLLKRYNPGYIIKNKTPVASFELKSSDLRSYYHENILAFGDLLHKLHPLAGQGYNMSIRDIKKLYELIKFRKDLGLDLDKSICKDFQKNRKHINYLFLTGIDFVYEFFNFESKKNSLFLTKSINSLGKNPLINNFFRKIGDVGLSSP